MLSRTAQDDDENPWLDPSDEPRLHGRGPRSQRTAQIRHGGQLTRTTWTQADLSGVLAVAKPETELALMLALWTGPRQGDLLSAMVLL